MTRTANRRVTCERDTAEKYGFDSLLLVGEYRRAGWRECAQRNEVARARWRRWTAALEPADAIFHEMPDGEETLYCVAFDLSKWDYAKHAFHHDAPKPDLAPLKRLYSEAGEECAFALLEAAHALSERWIRRGGGRGAPWRIIAGARQSARECDHVDFYRVRAGKGISDLFAERPKRKRPPRPPIDERMRVARERYEQEQRGTA